MENLIIRSAILQDMPAILELVKELAEYEKAPYEVTASVEDYKTNFENGVFEALVAEYQGKVIGMTLYFLHWSTWKGKMLFLEDFVIKKAFRRQGVGQMLFDAFLAEARKKNCVLTKWQVLDWNEPALNFYSRNNAIIEKDWWNGKMKL